MAAVGEGKMLHALSSVLPKHLVDWHEGRAALRMLVAALIAYTATTLVHLPGPYSAVITTLIVARPHSGGVLRASFERLTATILGAGIACVATFGRIVHIPEVLLIGLALSPLALVAAHNSAFRTAMIAAMIVLSAPATSGAPLYVAGVRMLGVTLGAVVGALVSVTVLPSRREVVVAHAVAKLLEDFGGLLRYAIYASASDANASETGVDASDTGAVAAQTRYSRASDARTRDRFEFRVRQSLRELGLLIRDRPDALPSKGPAAAMVKYTVQMHADIVFLKRELQGIFEAQTQNSAPPQPLEDFAQAFQSTATQLATTARGRAPPPDLQDLRTQCGHASHALRDRFPHSEGSRLMLRRLVEDLSALSRSIERAGL